MRVLDVYVTEGVSLYGEKKNKWQSRTAVCVDFFKSKDGEGEYIRIFTLNKGVEVPDCEDDVLPLFDERGRVAAFKPVQSDDE